MAPAAVLQNVQADFVSDGQVRVRATVENCTREQLTLTFEPSAGGNARHTDRSIGPRETRHYDFHFGGFAGQRQVEGCVTLLSASPG